MRMEEIFTWRLWPSDHRDHYRFHLLRPPPSRSGPTVDLITYYTMSPNSIPSPVSSSNTAWRPSSSNQTPSSNGHSDLLGPFQWLKLKSSSERKVSPAMGSLQGYYGLRHIDQKATAGGLEMSVYPKGGAHYLEDVTCTVFTYFEPTAESS